MATRQRDGSYREDNWGGGIDNLSRRGAVKPGCVRDAVNVSPTNGGTLTLRPGFEQVYAGQAVRGALAVGDVVLLADGQSLVEFNARTGSSRVLRQIAMVGAFAGTVLNGELFFCTENETLRYRAGVLRPWGVPTAPDPTITLAASEAPSPVGSYQVACTLVNEYGEEGGVLQPLRVSVPEGRALVVTPPTAPAGYRVRLYISVANGETLYLQAENPPGAMTFSRVRDDTARLMTIGETPPEPGQMVDSVGGTIVVASGSTVWLTNPLRPYARRLAERFFRYPSPIGLLAACGAGLYVSADKTYYLAGIDSDAPSQRVPLEYPAISGTGVALPDGRGAATGNVSTGKKVAWMTAYGLAVGSADGLVELVSADRHAPRVGSAGASGLMDHDGNQTVVTTMRGQAGRNPLAARDYFEVEVI